MQYDKNKNVPIASKMFTWLALSIILAICIIIPVVRTEDPFLKIASLEVLVVAFLIASTVSTRHIWWAQVAWLCRSAARLFRLAHAVLIGHPWYWYQAEDGGRRDWYEDGKGEFLVTTKPEDCGEFQRPHIYLPLGGIFRRPRIVWPSASAYRWRIERKLLGYGGYRLVDKHGMKLELWSTRFLSRHADSWGPLDMEECTMLFVGFDRDVEMHQWGRFSISQALEQRSVGWLYDELYSKLLLEKEEHEKAVDRARFDKEEIVAEHKKELAKLDDARKEAGMRLASELAKATALVKAAPRNKKLGAARHQLVAIMASLTGSEEKAKAMLMDAQDALEKEEGQSN